MSEVLITGMGVVSAIGVGRDEFAAALKARRCGISEVTGFDAEGCRCLLAAEVVDFDVEAFLESRKNYLDRNTELAFGAARLALDDSRLRISEENAERIGLSIGTAFGNVESVLTFHRQLVEKGARLVSPFIFPHTYNNTTASLLAIEHAQRWLRRWGLTYYGCCEPQTDRLDLIIEAFNVFDTTNYDVSSVDRFEFLSGPTLANPDRPYVPNSNFGQYRATLDPREIQLGMRYRF